MTIQRTLHRTVVVALTATGLLAVSATSASAKAPLCEKRGADVIAVSGTHRLLSEFTKSRTDADAGTLRVLHCRKGSRSARVLFKSASNLDSVKRVAQGTFVGKRGTPTLIAYGVTFDGGVSSSGNVYVHDMKSTKPLTTVQECVIDGFHVTRSGGVVFDGGDIVPGGLVTVDSTGRKVVATKGVSAVAVAGDRVYLTLGGTAAAVDLVGRSTGLVETPDTCG